MYVQNVVFNSRSREAAEAAIVACGYNASMAINPYEPPQTESKVPPAIIDPETAGTPDRWFVLCLLSVNYFTIYLHRNLINYLQPALIAELKLTDTQLGYLHWGFFLAYALAQLFVGYLSDRFQRRTLLLGSLVGSVAVLAAMGLAGSFVELLALRILLGVVQSVSVPAIAGIMADCFAAKGRSRAVSIYLLSSPFSIIAAGWLGGLIGDMAGWRVATFAFAGFGGLVVLLLLVLLREPQRTERTEQVGLGTGQASLSATLASVLTTPSFLALAVAYVLIFSVGQITLFWLPRHFSEQFGMSMGGSGAMATLWNQSGTVAGLLIGGVWGDLWARRWMSGRFGVQLIGLAAGIPALLVMAVSHDAWALRAAMFVLGLASWLYLANLWTTTFDVVDPAARSTAIGLLNLASGVLGGWLSPLVGNLREQGIVASLGSVFFGLALLTAVAAALLVLIIVVLLPRDFRGPQQGKPSLLKESS